MRNEQVRELIKYFKCRREPIFHENIAINIYEGKLEFTCSMSFPEDHPYNYEIDFEELLAQKLTRYINSEEVDSMKRMIEQIDHIRHMYMFHASQMNHDLEGELIKLKRNMIKELDKLTGDK
jgi:hypothetical protein